MNEPVYTATVGGDFAEKDLGHEYELIHWDAIVCTNFAELVKNVGTNENVIVPSGVVTQGNYMVTYYPGDLIVGEKTRLVSLWICDHADAGAGKEHLAIDPTLSCEKTAESFKAFVDDSVEKFSIVFGNTPDEPKSDTPVQIRYRKNANGNDGEQDIAKGWIWFTVTNSVLPNGSAPVLRKILWTP